MRHVIGSVILIASLFGTGCAPKGATSSPSVSPPLAQTYDAEKLSYKLDYSFQAPADPSQIDFVELREVDMSEYTLTDVATCAAGIPVKRWNGPFEANQKLNGFYLSGRVSKFRYALCVWNKDKTVTATVDALTLSPAAEGVQAAAALPTYTATKVTSGKYFTCALFSNGRIKCWGNNAKGQLGLGDTNPRGDAAGEMGASLPYIDLGTDTRGKTLLAIDVSAGFGHVCAVIADGSLKCWGDNAYGQLGLGNTQIRGDSSNEMGNNLPFVDLGTGMTAKAVGLGGEFSCALLNTNALKCWGRNDIGQLGRGDTLPRGNLASQMGNNLAPINLGTGRSVKDFSSGGEHVCAILDNNFVKCWGANDGGQLGRGNDDDLVGSHAGEMGDALPYVDLGTTLFIFPNYASEISLGSSHSCVITWLYQMKCWGDNAYGQLGVGSSLDVIGDSTNQMGNSLGNVDFGNYIMSLAQPIVKMQAGWSTTCAQLWTSEIKCWGLNNFGQAGIGSLRNDIGKLATDIGSGLSSVNIGNGSTLKMFSSQWGTTCVITQDSLIKCWGINLNGALGYGDTSNRGSQSSQMGSNLPYVGL